GVLVVLGGALAGLVPLAAGGLFLYAAGLAWWGRALIRPARTRPPREFATASVAASLVWGAVGLVWVAGETATDRSWGEVADGFGAVTAVLVVGFAAQLLPGALSYLIPSVLG